MVYLMLQEFYRIAFLRNLAIYTLLNLSILIAEERANLHTATEAEVVVEEEAVEVASGTTTVTERVV